MAWTAPRTYTAGEIITASIMNSAVRDNLRYIKGLDGVPTIESGLTIDNTDGDERLLLPLLSTAECSTVLNAEGEVAFDEQTHQMKEYDGTAVRALISEADVDDTPVNGATTVPVSSNWAYDFQQTLTTAGDIAYATGAGVWARLAADAGKYLYNNGSAPSWVTGTIPQYGIIIWAGTIVNIPTGFVICDGNNDSPNLLTKFIEGVATAATDPGATGGATNKTSDSHTLTAAEIPAHVHTVPYRLGSSALSHANAASLSGGDGSTDGNMNTSSIGSGNGHTHTITDIRPLYYDVAFIMKS